MSLLGPYAESAHDPTEPQQGDRPRNLGPRVYTAAYEMTPYVTPDGAFLIFARDRETLFRIPLDDALRVAEPTESEKSK